MTATRLSIASFAVAGLAALLYWALGRAFMAAWNSADNLLATTDILESA